MQFEWDQRKAAANLRKHDVAFTDAIAVFFDPRARIFPDPDHSEVEERELSSVTIPRLVCFTSVSSSGVVTFASSAPGVRPHTKPTPMKNTSSKQPRDELRGEYSLDYAKSKPNRFAAKLKGTTVIVLQPDVAEVFRSSEAVNNLLRSAIAATGANLTRQRPTHRSSGRR